MASYLVLRKFTGRHWLALAPSKLQSSQNLQSISDIVQFATTMKQNYHNFLELLPETSKEFRNVMYILWATGKALPVQDLLVAVRASDSYPSNPTCEAATARLQCAHLNPTH